MSKGPTVTQIDHFLAKILGKPGFDRTLEPALRIAPGTGETIGFETSDDVYAQLHERGSLDQVTAQINPVTGPVFVEGAQPGDTLVVTIHDILLGEHGWSVYLPESGALQHRMGGEAMSRKIALRDGSAQLTEHIRTDLQPMIGCIGVAPAEGRGSTLMPSYAFGGNMDLTDAKPGSKVYLPVEVEGALLSIGDIHAVMARGESSFVAIEAAGTAVVSVDLLRSPANDTDSSPVSPDSAPHASARAPHAPLRAPHTSLRAPRIETSEEWIFVGLGDPAQQSITRGYEDMFDFLVGDHGWSADDAYVVMSAVAHSELGGPTGSVGPDPLHPMTPVGAVTVHRLPKRVLEAGAGA